MDKKMWLVGVVSASLLLTNQALAHAVVKPNTTGIGKFQSFSLGVPSEKPIATIGVRLVLPEGLNYVTPNVKPGWKVEVKKQTSEHTMADGTKMTEEKATEIVWSGGTIPANMRDEFVFSAQVPSQPTTLIWKVYQLYSDRTVVFWDQDPKAPIMDHEAENQTADGPYSTTEVIDDLTTTTSPATSPANSDNSTATVALALSALALVLALAAFKKQAK